MNKALDTRLDELADLLADRMFDKLVAKLSSGEIELPLPPSDGAPARRPAAPAKTKPEPKQLPPAPAPASSGPKARTEARQRAAAGVAALMERKDPSNQGVKSARLTELLLGQGLTAAQAKRRIAEAKNAKLIRLRGRTAAATYFRP